MNREKVVYANLKGKAQEAFNAGKLAGAMARYGYELTPVRNDAEGADFVAYRAGEPALLIQLKGRPCIDKKYIGKDIWMAFPGKDPDSTVMFMVPHDRLVQIWRDNQPQGNSFENRAWLRDGVLHATSRWLFDALDDYRVGDQ